MRDHAVLYINGQRREVRGPQAFWMLSDYLRYDLGLTGTKIVCAEGDCGACTVLRGFVLPARPRSGRTKTKSNVLCFAPVNSCIALVAQMDGSQLITIEGLKKAGQIGEIQKAMAAEQGSQCGFCTPGFVMALAGRFERKCAKLDEKQARNALTGNLCRCTGYQPILEAATAIDPKRVENLRARYTSSVIEKDLANVLREPLHIEAEGSSSAPEHRDFFAPVNWKEAARFLGRRRDARLIGASTDLGVQVNKGRFDPRALLSLHLVPEAYAIGQVRDKARTWIEVGARVTLTELRDFVEPLVPEFAKFLNLFASPQIKNVATLVGNVANGSPIGDTLPFLMAMDAEVDVVGPRGRRSVPFVDFYKGYKKLDLRPGEIVTAVRFAAPAKGEQVRLFKVSQRKDLDISSVNAAFRVKMGKDGSVIEARVVFGGVGPTVLRLRTVERALTGPRPTEATLTRASEAMRKEMTLLSDVRGSAEYREMLCENLFRKFASETLGVRS